MTPPVIRVQFAPLAEVVVGDWKIRLTEVPKSPTLPLRGEQVGEPPDEQRYSWEFHPSSNAVVVRPHPRANVPEFRCGIPDDSLREPLWKMIREHTKEQST